MADQPDIRTDSPFRLGDWTVDPAAGRLSRDGETHKLEPKAMTVLLCLARQPGRVLSREALEEQAWAGMVVGYDSLASAIIKLRKALGDDSRNPRYIETVPKRGYRLICPVSTLAGELTDRPATTSGAAITRSDRDRSHKASFTRYIVAGLTLAALLLAGLMALRNEEAPRIPVTTRDSHLPVIAVLPFKNISDDAQQDYFSDGITADLITDLSKLSGLSVIARNSVFTFRNTDVDIRKVKQELGADYVVEGSIRKIGKQVRITARLIDADTGINLWADRFDGTLENIFSFQDSVTSQIIASLEIKLTDNDRQRLAHKYSNSIEAYDEFLHGWQNLWLSSREGMLQAREYFYRAIELDPQFGRAYANLALTYIYDHMLGWTDGSPTAIESAHRYADRAIAINPNLPQVYWVKGFADIFTGDYQQSLAHAQRALDLDPNFADAYGLLATTLNYAGKPDQADIEMRKAMQLDPKHPVIYNVIHGEIFFNKRDYASAIDNFRFALEANPESEESRLWLAAAYAHIGELDEASWQLEQIRMSGRDLSLGHFQDAIPFKDPEQRQHLIDGLFKAGLTE